MSRIPGWMLRHQVTVEPYAGPGAHGPLYGPPTTVPCWLDETAREVHAPNGETVMATSTAYCRLDVAAPVESRVTFPDGHQARVIAALRRDGGGMPTPDYLELQLA